MGEDSDVEATPITFHVKSSSDAKWTVTVDPSITVADLKTKLEAPDYADVPASRQRLIYSGRVLKDADTLASYNVKEGNTVHLVKSAQSNQPPQPRGQSSATGTGRSTPGQTPAAVPTNIAAGTGNNPLAGLTGARYAGFAQLPGAGMFGPDGGMGPPPDTEQMLNMLENPQFQSSINEALQNPQLIDLMIQQTPMLRDMGPGVRQMLQSPMFRRMLTDPNMIRQVTQMQRAMGMGPFGRAGGGNAAFPAPGVTNTTPQENRDEQQQQPQDPNNAQTPPNPFAFGTFGMPPGQGVAANPFAALFGAFPPPAGGAGGDAANAPGSGTATTQAPSDAAAQGTAGAGASPAPGSTGGAAAGADPNAQNPFASLFNPAFFGTPGAAPNPNSQQAPNPAANPFMNNPFMQDPALFNQMLQAVGGQAQAQNPDNNPFASMFGTGRAQSPPDSRPPEERYAQQLSQLNDMGFYDFDRNVEALRRAGGNVQGAVEYLLSNP